MPAATSQYGRLSGARRRLFGALLVVLLLGSAVFVYAGPLWPIFLAIPLVTAGGLAWYLYESWRAVVVALLVTLSLLALADHTLGPNRGQNGSGPPSGFTNRP